MAEQEVCHTCNRKHDCREAHQHMGDIEGPSFVVKVLLAFLLPLVVFIVSLAIYERILDGVISSKAAQTVVSFLLALLTTFVCIVITRLASKYFGYDA